jgi:hypothetical protein
MSTAHVSPSSAVALNAPRARTTSPLLRCAMMVQLSPSAKSVPRPTPHETRNSSVHAAAFPHYRCRHFRRRLLMQAGCRRMSRRCESAVQVTVAGAVWATTCHPHRLTRPQACFSPNWPTLSRRPHLHIVSRSTLGTTARSYASSPGLALSHYGGLHSVQKLSLKYVPCVRA